MYAGEHYAYSIFANSRVGIAGFDGTAFLVAQEPAKPKPEDTEVWEPVPKIVTPGATSAGPPSDAIVLFDGKNLDEWVSAQDHSPAKWDRGERHHDGEQGARRGQH